MKEEKEKPYIETNYSWTWNCPKKDCDASNSVELDGDGFNVPLKCNGCGAEFDEYEYYG